MLSDANKSTLFAQVLDDYNDWFLQVVRAAFYPERILKNSIKVPAHIYDQLNQLVNKDQIAQSVVDEVMTIQRDLFGQADQLLGKGEKPDIQTFDTFIQVYESFIQRLERLDLDSMISNFGLDALTGLRSSTVMVKDLERELERRARRGHAFSIVLGAVDDPDPAKLSERLKIAAKCLRKCMRSFDDAYLSGKNELLVSLKQTDNAGALRFVERLKSELDEINADFTMSFCAAEPMPGDDLEILIRNVRDDLRELSSMGRGEAAEYEEISPLQRYIKSMNPEE